MKQQTWYAVEICCIYGQGNNSRIFQNRARSVEAVGELKELKEDWLICREWGISEKILSPT